MRYSLLIFLTSLVLLMSCSKPDFDSSLRSADANLGIGRIGAALHIYGDIVENFPDDSRTAAVMLQVARIHSDLGRDDAKAVEFYQRVIEKYPITNAGRIAFEEHAKYMESRGEYESAAEDLLSLIKYFPERAPWYNVVLAGQYISSKKYSDARSLLEPVFGSKDVSEEILEAAAFTYAESFFVEGKTAEARKWFAAFIKDFPDSKLSAEAKLHLATTFEEMGRLGAARRVTLNAGNYPNKRVLEARLDSIDKRGRKFSEKSDEKVSGSALKGD